MQDDEAAIRELVSKWMAATKAGDIDTVLGLMTDDVVFMTVGREPFGKREFAAASKPMSGVKFDGTSEILELRVIGDWAWTRNRIRLVVKPTGGETLVREGYTLAILRKDKSGKWAICRDANLVTNVKTTEADFWSKGKGPN